MQTRCIFCGADVMLVHVHGHYQCPLCKTNALPCCDADNCDNFLLDTGGGRNKEIKEMIEEQPLKSSTEQGKGIFSP